MGRACGTHGGKRNGYKALVGIPKEGDHFEDIGVDGKVILKCTFKEWGGCAWMGFIGHRVGTGCGVL